MCDLKDLTILSVKDIFQLKNMKTRILIAFLIFTAGLIFAGANIPQGLNIRSDGNNIIIAWQAISETNLKQYIIQRKSGNGDYIDVVWINPRADMNYKFTDSEVFKTTGSWYKYRLKIVDNDGSATYLEQLGMISPNISSVKRTWGSIKALFR